jgi:hypothetical protein
VILEPGREKKDADRPDFISCEVGDYLPGTPTASFDPLVKSVFDAFVAGVSRDCPLPPETRRAGRAGVPRLRTFLRLGLGTAMRRCV